MNIITEDLNRDEEHVRKRGLPPLFGGKRGPAPLPDSF
jgi:hypothetical protein